jgi:hypothetical protein
MSLWERAGTGFLALMLVALFARGGMGPIYESQTSRMQTPRTVEIRSYNLKPGARAEFHRLASEVAVPMLKRWKIDVVGYGPSLHDDTTYFLIRSFASVADRERSEDAFYGSDEWRYGPRDSVLALIDSYTTIVLTVDAAGVRELRKAVSAAPER